MTKSLFSGAIAQETVGQTGLSFGELGLSAAVTEVLERAGFQHPTPIQAAAIPPALEGRDLIGLAQTGSGKTAAFALPLVERVVASGGEPGGTALVLAPTREIALQTQGLLEIFREPSGVRNACLIGGVAYGPQLAALKARPHVVVATPGRLLDHAERRAVRLGDVKTFVLDEADHMLDLGFLPQIRRVVEQLPEKRQNLQFSATMPEPIDRLVRRMMHEPVTIDLRPSGRAAAGIEHRIYLVDQENMKPCLLELVDGEPGSMLIFLPRKIDAEWAHRQLEKAGHPVERIHGDRSQRERLQALTGLKAGEHRVLIATDIAARGIDLPMVRHVVNFGMPDTVEDYVHRAGRTARGKASGVVSTIATWRDKPQVKRVEEEIGATLTRSRVPGVEPYEELPTTRRPRIRRRLL
ncbi:MAG: DEAD/DEAH box helicase [Thermoanaerobaculia bacterium]